MVSRDRRSAPTRLMAAVAVAGAPLAWAAQHVIGFGITQAGCEKAGTRWGVPIDTLVIGVTAVGAAVAVLACVCAVLVFRATWGAGAKGPPPDGRLHFLAIAAMVVSPLLLAIMLMSGVGTVVLSGCHQG
jgi:hypothetical protein